MFTLAGKSLIFEALPHLIEKQHKNSNVRVLIVEPLNAIIYEQLRR